MEIATQNLDLTIKWNKESLNLQVSENETLDDFRFLIYSLTQVQPEKQKIIYKGKILKELGQSLKNFGITNVP